MKRKSYLEKYWALVNPRQRLPGCRVHPAPHLQRAFEAGVSSGMDPRSLDPYQDNPHPSQGRRRLREAWGQGWVVGAEMAFVHPVAIEAGAAITTEQGRTPPGVRNLFGAETEAGSAKAPGLCVHQTFED